MNIRFHLKDDVMRLEGFQVVEKQDKWNKWQEYRFHGDYVFVDSGRFYVDVGTLWKLLNPVLMSVVDEISLRDTFPWEPKRTAGVYHQGDAKGVVESLEIVRDIHYREIHHQVAITGKTYENVVNLYLAIRAGKILPSESWEVAQVRPRVIWARVLAFLRIKRANVQ